MAVDHPEEISSLAVQCPTNFIGIFFGKETVGEFSASLTFCN
jgi:hypothetical protein